MDRLHLVLTAGGDCGR